MKPKNIIIVLLSLFLIRNSFGQNNDSITPSYYYNLKELSNIKIVTGSIKEENAQNAPSNITVITKQMIEERGYQTLVDICQDIPGFDFMSYNDGGGEYPTYNMHRGIGEIGNPEILIMIDGIIQNSISFNWSLLWTYDNIISDVDRIEIIQGPGSVMYGAQAFTGVIHIITQKNFSGVSVKSLTGLNQTFGSDINLGIPLSGKSNLNITFHKYSSLGDNGLHRYDPGGYFHDNRYPSIIVSDYDSSGNYIENYANPKGGKKIPDGFNTKNNSYAFRTKLTYKNTELGFFIADIIRGNASAILPYEYEITDPDNTHHYRSFHTYLMNSNKINSKTILKSEIVFRGTNIIPDGGFKYLYQFPDLTKKYAAYSYQAYIDEKILFNLNSKNIISVGIKSALIQKSERIVSLGGKLTSHNVTTSSWDIASEAGGINQYKSYPVYYTKEIALFALWDKQWQKSTSSSAGIRYDYSTEYGNILNPRLAIDFNPKPQIGFKLMYGTAFRQPSIFELTSEFRGNANLLPEKIKTSEFEAHSKLLNEALFMKFNIYFSKTENFIGKVNDSLKPAGERYENIEGKYFSGISVNLNVHLLKYLDIYSNYNFLTGLQTDTFRLTEIERTARHKVNAGINLKFFKTKLITDIRMNYVGKRKAHTDNTWLQTYENGYAPSYTKFNLSVIYNITSNLRTQLVCNNLFNVGYYGHGRETGSGFIDDYDYLNNVNPPGHIPAYHPQPGRTFLIYIIFNINNNE